MAGNVWEWCADWYDDEVYKRYVRGSVAPPTNGSDRVGRGGSWISPARYVRTAYRSRGSPGLRYNYLGFRPARVAP